MVYELEFFANGAEYEYDVDASTGAIVKFSREGGWSGQTSQAGQSGGGASGSGQSAPQSAGDIGAQAALDAALAHAGLSQSQIYELEVKQEWDDGRLEYEIEFKSGRWEYEYKLLAADGSILEFERDD